MTSRDDRDLEAELLALGDLLDVPAPPPAETAAAVRARLERPEPEPRPAGRVPARRRWGLIAVIVAVVLALAAAATIWVVRSTGVEIRVGDPGRTPTATASLPAEREATLEEARRVAPFPLRLPAELGPPARVRVAEWGRIVTMTWPDGVRLDQFAGGISPMFLKRMGGADWPEELVIGGGSGWWIAKPHVLSYLTRQDGREVPLRVADATLVWGEGEVGHRLEGVKDRDRALEVARSLR
ncbi:hypothetical protein [Nonomuraea sp. NPDC050310]|uniref:hypothetical protein n=1 Tax=Nonomuraea sp. NPDC050310 TaxID=3154935 RepID=UPI0033D2EDCF